MGNRGNERVHAKKDSKGQAGSVWIGWGSIRQIERSAHSLEIGGKIRSYGLLTSLT